jgi:hypothetical protein
MKARGKRRKTGALIAALAAPLIVIAVLPGTIAGKLGASQASLLIGDSILTLLLLVILVFSARRRPS